MSNSTRVCIYITIHIYVYYYYIITSLGCLYFYIKCIKMHLTHVTVWSIFSTQLHSTVFVKHYFIVAYFFYIPPIIFIVYFFPHISVSHSRKTTPHILRYVSPDSYRIPFPHSPLRLAWRHHNRKWSSGRGGLGPLGAEQQSTRGGRGREKTLWTAP